MSLFVTGTDTGVGKTFAAVRFLQAARAAGLRCAGYKPVCCGDRHDAELLLASSSDGLTLDDVNPLWFRTPVAPFTASAIEQKVVDVDRLLEGFANLQKRFDYVVVEGAGGWLVPLREDLTLGDLALQLGLPIVVIARNRLGMLNHTLLTVRQISLGGGECRGVILNHLDEQTDFATTTNGAILRRLLAQPVFDALPSETGELSAAWRHALAFGDEKRRSNDDAHRAKDPQNG